MLAAMVPDFAVGALFEELRTEFGNLAREAGLALNPNEARASAKLSSIASARRSLIFSGCAPGWHRGGRSGRDLCGQGRLVSMAIG
jgi:hypothetical protein